MAFSAIQFTLLGVVIGLMLNAVNALPGDGTTESLQSQKCGTGCITGLIMMACIITLFSTALVCCTTWYAPELKSRIERRKAARKGHEPVREKVEVRHEADCNTSHENDQA